MNYGLIGPRDFNGEEYTNYDHVKRVLESFTDMQSLVTGGSRGVERLAQRFADETDLPHRIVKPNIRLHGSTDAFVIRDAEIAGCVDALIVFWDGDTRATMRLLTQCMKIGREVTLIPMR